MLPRKTRWFTRTRLALVDTGPITVTSPAGARTCFVSPSGNDANPGTFPLPYATLGKACGAANPGDLIYLRGGTYNCTAVVYIKRSGTADHPIRIFGYPGEQPVLDFSAMTATNAYGISIAGSYWHLRGIEVYNTPGTGIRMVGHNTNNPAGSYNIIERCVARACRLTGIAVGDGSAVTFLPGHNLILNCDATRCFDAVNHGENADGFTAHYTIGPGNVFRGCRAWENSDDGWDLWMASEPVLIENCWAFGQGRDFWNDPLFTGNGNGFKLGGNNVATPHRLVRSLAAHNAHNGIDQNDNAAGLTVDHCTAWANLNGDLRLDISITRTEPHIVRNNIALGRADVTATTTLLGNSWQVLASAPNSTDFLLLPTATDAATIAQVTALLAAPRRTDGGLPELALARPSLAGRLVDAGTLFDDADYLGCSLTFLGPAPDLGAFETATW